MLIPDAAATVAMLVNTFDVLEADISKLPSEISQKNFFNFNAACEIYTHVQ